MALPLFVASHRFDPRSIPGLESWWDAADAASVTLDSGRVSQLSDKSGKGRHAANTTSGSTQPSYVTAGRNGLNVARFAAASVQRLTVASSTATYNFLHNGTDSWIAAVSSYGTSSDPGALHTLLSNNGIGSANTGFAWAYDDRGLGTPALNNSFQFNITKSVTGFFCANNNNAGNTGILDVFNNVFTPNTLLVQECVYDADNATADQRVRLRINGGSEIVGNNKTETPSTGNATFSLQLGAAGNNNFPLTGDICELLIFSQIPTAAARDLIRRYLGSKWGIALA